MCSPLGPYDCSYCGPFQVCSCGRYDRSISLLEEFRTEVAPKPPKWQIRRVTHTSTFRGEKVVTHRWWLTKPQGSFQDWVAQKVGTFEECRQEFIRVTGR